MVLPRLMDIVCKVKSIALLAANAVPGGEIATLILELWDHVAEQSSFVECLSEAFSNFLVDADNLEFLESGTIVDEACSDFLFDARIKVGEDYSKFLYGATINVGEELQYEMATRSAVDDRVKENLRVRSHWSRDMKLFFE